MVHGFALAADHGSGRLVNIGTGVETSVNGLYRMLANLTGFSGEPGHGPVTRGAPGVRLDNALAAEASAGGPTSRTALGETARSSKASEYATGAVPPSGRTSSLSGH